jgi:hypothetical protein
MRRQLALALALFAALAGPAAAPAAAQAWSAPEEAAVPTRPWIVDRTGLTAVPLPARGWCPLPGEGGIVRVRIDALDRETFRPPRIGLQRFLSGVRFLVQQDCAAAEAIEVVGYASGTRTFVGSMTAHRAWQLQGAMLQN